MPRLIKGYASYSAGMGGQEDDAVSVAAHPFPGGMRFSIIGAMDLANAAPVAGLLRNATRDLGLSVVIDLDAVTFLDSQGIAQLHRLHRDFAEAGRSLQLTADPRTVAGKVLRLTGLDTVWGGPRLGPPVVNPRRASR